MKSAEHDVNKGNPSEKDIPSEDEIRARADKHLRRLTLGRMFPSYQAEWSAKEAREFVALIRELCEVLDTLGPALLDEARARRREEAGLPSGRGRIISASLKRQSISGGYADVMKQICDMLDSAVETGGVCRWNCIGCGAMHSVLEELIRKSTRVLPALLEEARQAPPDTWEMERGYS